MAIDKQLIVKLGLEVKDWLKSASQLDSSTKNFNNQLNKLLATSKNTFLVAEALIDSTNKKYKALEAQVSKLNVAAERNNDTIKKQAASIARLKAALDKAGKAKAKQIEQLNQLKQAKQEQKAQEKEEIARKKQIAQALKQVGSEIKRGLQESKKALAEQESSEAALFKAKLNRIKLNSNLIKTRNALELRLTKEKEAFITSSENSIANLVKGYLTERSRLAKQVAADTIKAENQMAAVVRKHLSERKKLTKQIAADTIKAENEMGAVVRKHIIDRDNGIRKTAIANRKAEREIAALVKGHLKEKELAAKAYESRLRVFFKQRKRAAQEALRAEAREARKTEIALRKLEAQNKKSRQQWARFTSNVAGGLGNLASKLRQFEIIFDAVFNGKLREAIDNFAEFDAAVRASMGLLPPAQQDIKGFSKQFDELGEKFGILPIEQAKAFYKAISNRLSPDAAIAMLPLANKVAIATQSDLADTVKAGTDVMNGFGEELSSLPKIYNSMANAVRTGQITLTDFNTKLGDVIPVARASGISLDEVLSLFSELTIGGLAPAKALTQMKRLFVSITAPTKEAAGAFAQFGIDTSKARIQADGFGAVLDEILQATAGDPDRLREFLPNIRALLPALQVMQDNLKGLNKTTLEQAKNVDALGIAYKVNSEGADRDIKKLQASVNVATKQIGLDFITMARSYTEAGNGINDLQTSVKKFISLSGIVGQTFVAAFFTLGRVGRTIALSIKNTGLVVFGAIELLGLGVKDLFKSILGTIGDMLFTLTSGIFKGLGKIVSVLKDVDDAIGGFFTDELTKAEESLNGLSQTFKSIAIEAGSIGDFGDTKKAFNDLFKTFDNGTEDMSDSLKEFPLLWDAVHQSMIRHNVEFRKKVVLGQRDLEIGEETAALNKRNAEDEKDNIRRKLEAAEKLAQAKALAAKEAKEQAKIDKQIAKDEAKAQKAREKSLKKQSDLLKKLAGEKAAARSTAKNVGGLTVDAKELAGIDPAELAKQFGSFQRTNKIFINENIVAVRRLIGGSMKVVLEESQAAFLRRKNEFRDTTIEATDGIVQGLQKLADQISPVVAQLTFDSDKLGRDAIRRSDDALRSSPFFNQAAGGLGARAQANFAFRTGSFSGFNSGGSVGIKRFANGGPSTPLPNVDSVPALLTPGEFVINKESAAAFLPALQRINRTSGGNVSNTNNTSTQNNTFNFSGSGGITPDQVRREIIPVIRAQERMGRK